MSGRSVPWRRSGEGEIELHLRADDLPAEMTLQRLELEEGRAGLAVPFWNPHCVVAVSDLEGAPLARWAARAAERKDLFPIGVNLEAVAEGGPGRLRARVFERGVGETRACGSGAVAVALAAWAARGSAGPLEVVLPGGSLHLKPSPEGGILLRGAAELGTSRTVPLKGCPA